MGQSPYILVRSEKVKTFNFLSLTSYMKLSFFGAAGEVTGSCSMVTIGSQKFLIDCGMFQGSPELEAKNKEPLPFNPAELSGVMVTHAHLDHVGRLPLLVKNGYEGKIFATAPTAELAELIMEDALHIMIYNHRKSGAEILYDSADIAKVMERFTAVDYHQKHSLGSGISFTLHDAGHIFGSAFIEIEAEGKRVVFSGDVGNVNVPILQDTESLPKDIDVLVCESTYGDRIHENSAKREEILSSLISAAISRGGTLMIPSFSLERTQELVYELNNLVDRQHVLPRIPIFLDSPLAIKATRIYLKYPQYYDAEASRLLKNGDDLFNFPGLVITETKEESKKINNTPGPKIIIAGSGMMNGGRILHHALRYLSDAKNTLLIVGYQSYGTLGRNILEGHSPVDVMGEKVAVHCQVKAIGALSAHADQAKFLTWIGAGKPKKVILNHGEEQVSSSLAQKLREVTGVEAIPARFGEEIEV
jgi:metallo-beta-lactamase family protein